MADPTPDSIARYNSDAAALAARYESVAAAQIYSSIRDLIPSGPGLALDVGAGSGRDAAWLSSLGHEVVAVEPSTAMAREGRRRHAQHTIRWLDDRLPDLSATHRLGLAFDLVLAGAVWMHVPPVHRQRAFRKLVTLLKPSGVFILTLRNGPDELGRPMWPTSVGEIEALARAHGLAVIRSISTHDQLGRDDISWTTMCLQLPDDSTAALPLLRGIILNDDKASTYKLALLRSIARVADTAAGLALERRDEDVVDVPFGLVALNWIRMFLPLVASALPQAPGNVGPKGLGFAGEGFCALFGLGVAAQELRIGARFSAERARVVAKALAEAKTTIARMPANFIRYPNSEIRVFAAEPARGARAPSSILLDAASLSSYGSIGVPGHVWRAMQRLGAWIEPVLIAEWARMVRQYADRMGRSVPPGVAESALVWLEPARDTSLARQVAKRLVERGTVLRCVWTGAQLHQDALDIDHCLPWSAWPCGDLWNLLPTSRRVNQQMKRDRLPTAGALAAARTEIVAWWEEAWRADAALGERFDREVAATLPVPTGAESDEIFAGLEWRRLRLRQDQQVPEWKGAGTRKSSIQTS